MSVGADLGTTSGSSDERSSSTASDFAREVTENATSSVRERSMTQIVARSRRRTQEVNEHRFENDDDDARHIVGIYRWVDQVLRVQLFRYGKRMMLEFVVPEPAAWLAYSLAARPPGGVTLDAPVPLEETAAEIDEGNYLEVAARYGATEIQPPPPRYTQVTTTLSAEPANRVDMPSDVDDSEPTRAYSAHTKTVQVPDGYEATRATVIATWGQHGRWVDLAEEAAQNLPDVPWAPAPELPTGWELDNLQRIRLAIGDRYLVVLNDPDRDKIVDLDLGSHSAGELAIAMAANQKRGVAVAIEIRCERTDEAWTKWQIDTWERLRAAHDAMKAAFEAQVQLATLQGAPAAGTDADSLRAVEAREIKRGVLTLLTGQHFQRFGALLAGAGGAPRIHLDEAAVEGDYVQFFEDAFEWPQMSYVLYPGVWAGRDRWLELDGRTDNDPVHRTFLQAGSSRAVVPVRRGYEQAIWRYLQDGTLWNGGAPPTLAGDQVPHVPVFELLAEESGRPGEEEPVGEPWEVTLPTGLVMLQEDAELNPQ